MENSDVNEVIAICKVLLTKVRLSDFVRCQCGWEWQGHTDRKPAVTP